MTRAGLLVIAAAGAAACANPPPLVVDYALAPGPTQVCTTITGQRATSCTDVSLRCDATLSVRIVSPDQPDQPFVTLCEPITGRRNLCSIAGILLPEPTVKVPAETLEVEVAIYPTSALCSDPSDPTGQTKLCPTSVKYDFATGLPDAIAQTCDPTLPCDCPPIPAIGGRSYYHPGDRSTTVELGCTDLHQIDDPTCIGPSTVTIAATVEDFDTLLSVAPSTADQLSVSVGEPRAITVGTTTEYVLEPSDARVLPRTIIQPVPGWGGDVDLTFTTAACLDVLEDAPQSTAALACKTGTAAQPRVDLTGYRLGKPTLDQILSAVSLAQFPTQGLVVGLVLDDLGNPIPNMTVTASAGTIDYLAADKKTIIAGGTSTNGIFLSRDAPFGTTFSTRNATLQVATGFGGLVDGKVTIAVVQFGTPPNN